MADPSGNFTVTIKGLKEIQDKLEQLPKKVSESIVKKALDDAATIVQDKMRDLAPEASGEWEGAPVGFLRDNINKKVGKVQSSARGLIVATIFVGPSTKKDFPLSGGGYKTRTLKSGKTKKGIGRIGVYAVARFLEFGTARSSARPFIRPAWLSTQQQALNTIISSLRSALGLQ
jgi:HK97 gp10 family phage protein